MGNVVDDSSKKILENYVNDLIRKGYKKRDIKNKLLGGGYDNILVNKLLYPYLSVLVIAGIILVLMIIVFSSVAVYFLIADGTVDDGSEVADSKALSLPNDFCRSLLENPEMYAERRDYEGLIEECSGSNLGSASLLGGTNCSEEYSDVEDEGERILMEDRCYYNEGVGGNLESCGKIVDEIVRMTCEEVTEDGLG